MCTRRSLRRRSLDCCDVAIENLDRHTHANDLLFGRELVAAKGWHVKHRLTQHRRLATPSHNRGWLP